MIVNDAEIKLNPPTSWVPPKMNPNPFESSLTQSVQPLTFQRCRPASGPPRPSPTRSRSSTSWAGTGAAGRLSSTPIWRWEERTSRWASGRGRVLHCCSPSTPSTGNTWCCCSTSTVRGQHRTAPHTHPPLFLRGDNPVLAEQLPPFSPPPP